MPGTIVICSNSGNPLPFDPKSQIETGNLPQSPGHFTRDRPLYLPLIAFIHL
jgi:hypothetical protein